MKPRRKRRTATRQTLNLERVCVELLQRGVIHSGDTIEVVNNPKGSPEEAYAAFHWGNRPKNRSRRTLPDFSELYELGPLLRVEYLAKKGREKAIWVHDFDGPPYPVLTATPRGELGPILGGRARVTSRGIEH